MFAVMGIELRVFELGYIPSAFFILRQELAKSLNCIGLAQTFNLCVSAQLWNYRCVPPQLALNADLTHIFLKAKIVEFSF